MASEEETTIRLQIVAGGQVCPRVVKAAPSGDRELVEVAGFTFIRKRAKAPEPAAQHASPKRARNEDCTPGRLSMQPAELNSTSLGRNMAAQPGLSVESLPQLTVTADAQMPQQDAEQEQPLTERLLQLLPDNCPTATKVQLLVMQLLQQPSAPTQTAGAASGGEDLTAAVQQLGERFCTLLTRHISAVRHGLIHQSTQPTQPPAEAESAPQDTPNKPASEYSMLAPMVRSAAEGPGLQAALTTHLEALSAEESCWLQLQQQHPAPAPPTAAAVLNSPSAAVLAGPDAGDVPAPGEQLTAGEVRVQAAGEPPQATAGDDEQPVTGTDVAVVDVGGGDGGGDAAEPAAAASVHQAVATQADPECALALAAETAYAAMATQVDVLEGEAAQAQVLIRRATQAAAHIQAQYHADKFTGLPHLNSPQVLIRNITTMPAVALGGMKPATPMPAH